MIEGEKPCPRCRIAKPFSEFSKDASHGDGLRSSCKDCCNSANRKRYAEDDAYREKVLKHCIEWQKANKETVNKKNADWRKRNPEKTQASRDAWDAANPERFREYRRLKNQRASARRRIRMAEAVVIAFTQAQFEARWAYYAGKCWICGGEATEADHVKPIAKGGSHMLCNIRPACRSCNACKSDKWPYSPPGRYDLAAAV